LLGLKLLPEYERKLLKSKGNQNPAAIFMAWDYFRNSPTGEEVQQAAYYSDLILGYYYG
jgi:hypothetical protein